MVRHNWQIESILQKSLKVFWISFLVMAYLTLAECYESGTKDWWSWEQFLSVILCLKRIMLLSLRVLRKMLGGIDDNSRITNHLHFVNQVDKGFCIHLLKELHDPQRLLLKYLCNYTVCCLKVMNSWISLNVLRKKHEIEIIKNQHTGEYLKFGF